MGNVIQHTTNVCNSDANTLNFTLPAPSYSSTTLSRPLMKDGDSPECPYAHGLLAKVRCNAGRLAVHSTLSHHPHHTAAFSKCMTQHGEGHRLLTWELCHPRGRSGAAESP